MVNDLVDVLSPANHTGLHQSYCVHDRPTPTSDIALHLGVHYRPTPTSDAALHVGVHDRHTLTGEAGFHVGVNELVI